MIEWKVRQRKTLMSLQQPMLWKSRLSVASFWMVRETRQRAELRAWFGHHASDQRAEVLWLR